ncbi:hypothetical protein MRB53_038729 [Persea americana]|nr:hypothetical protein MRB53_038729 [Persea americana]
MLTSCYDLHPCMWRQHKAKLFRVQDSPSTSSHNPRRSSNPSKSMRGMQRLSRELPSRAYRQLSTRRSDVTRKLHSISTSSHILSIPSAVRISLDNTQTRNRISRPSSRRAYATPSAKDEKPSEPGPNARVASALAEQNAPDLVSEVRVPEDAGGILRHDHPAMAILGNSSLVIQRQIEMMNIIIGVEQANKYIIMDGQGNTLGYMAERDHGIGSAIVRQAARTHRSFTTHIFDLEMKEVLRIHRPFAYISSRIRIYDPIPAEGYDPTNTDSVPPETQISPLDLSEMQIIGECQQRWSAVKRKYELYHFRKNESASLLAAPATITSEGSPSNSTALTESNASDKAIESRMEQFAKIDEMMLSWDFTVKEEDGKVIASINRNFSGFAREIFTDTGVYVLRMDSAAQMSALETAEGKEIARYEIPALTLDQRAVMIATAVSVDFDFFSRHSHSGPGMMPMFIPWGGTAAEGGAVAGGAAAGEAAGGAVIGEAAGAATGAAGRGIAGAGVGAAESGIAGAGTIAGYEAMQRGVYGGGDDASPVNSQTDSQPFTPDQTQGGSGEQDVWGAEQDPWSEQASDAGSGEGGGWIQTIVDWFTDT